MKIYPISKRLRNVFGRLAFELDESLELAKHLDVPKEEYELFEDDINILKEFVTCFDVNGGVSQRGEIPSCWNKDTIFDNYEEHEQRFNFPYERSQLEFDWDAKKTEEIKCPLCKGKGVEEEKNKGYRRYKCHSCNGNKKIEIEIGE